MLAISHNLYVDAARVSGCRDLRINLFGKEGRLP
jgi:hypothetical protein